MTLNDWLDKGWLVKYHPDRRELRELLDIAALAATGYRAGREAHHYRTIQSLAFTISASTDLVDQLDSFRKKRNIGDYERAGAVSEQEAREMLALTKLLRQTVTEGLKNNHPELV